MGKDFKFIDLFAGIGGIRIPFQELGGECVFTSEWDPHAQKTYEANFNEVPFGDITLVDAKDVPDHNILLAGFPCQPFSIIGEKEGFSDTRGTLFFDIERIIEEKRPDAFLLENVKHLVGHNKGNTFKVIKEHLSKLGYTFYYKVLNALDYGLPQKRERVIIVGFRERLPFKWPEPHKQRALLSDILEKENEVCPSLFASEKIQKDRLLKYRGEHFSPSIWHQNKSGNISALPYSCALRAGASYNYLLVDGKRRPSARELIRLQGFPEDFIIPVSYTQMRKQAGNSVPVSVIRAVAKEMLTSLNNKLPTKAEAKQPQINVSPEQMECVNG